MLKNRAKEILIASIEDFIKTGEPITSEKLFKLHDFGIKSAMIRWELHDLSEDGYFFQVHASSGRIPSDKAYQFLVDMVIENLVTEAENELLEKELQHCLSTLLEGKKTKFIQKFSDSLNTLGIFYESNPEVMYHSGLNELFEQCEEINKKDMAEIFNDIDFLPERLAAERDWWLRESDWPQVFVGKSPVTSSKNISLVLSKIPVSENETSLIALIGPKRMDYRKSIHSLNYFNKNLNVI